MKTILRLMQIMMVVVLIFSGYHLFNFFSTSETAIVANQKNEGFCGTVSTTSNQNLSPMETDGKALFYANCASCHKADKDLVGPALLGVMERWPDKKLLYSWIRNSQAILKSGNEYANDLYKKWDKTPMPLFPNLTDAEINSILQYLRQYKPQQYSPAYIASL